MSASTDIAFWQTSYERHGSAVLAFLTSRLGSRDTAEDLLQETFVRAIRTATPMRDVGKVRSYLMSTAHRLILNRARRRRPIPFADLAPAAVEDETARRPAESAAPDELADLGLLRDRLRGVLGALPADHRRAFEAAVLEERSYAEIAEREGWTIDQVRMNVYRGRKRAMQELRHLLRVAEEER
ncbi:MAG: RNA polymerase sigma factor [Thermoanaerobaculia bacterium]|nr:RNA polymerase sigma factor [Thermoanaerobaculia bacterium]